MRLLCIILQYPPDTNASGQLIAQLCRGLAGVGHRITVITSFPHYESFRVLPEYRNRFYSRERGGDVEVIRLFAYAPGRKTMIHRLVSYLVFNILALITALLLCDRWDALLCVNGSFFTGITGWLVGTIKRAGFVYNVQDLYPDVPISAGQLRNRLAISALRLLETFMYRKAAHITVISPAIEAKLVARGVPQQQISTIPNFTDTRFIRPLPRLNKFASEHGLSDRFVVMHAGNLGYVYDLYTLIDAALLLSNTPEILIAIVGNGVMKSELVKRAEALRLKNIVFLPFEPYENLPWLRASADIHISLYKPGAAWESFPSKIYEIMASGRALLVGVDAESELARFVSDSNSGLCVAPGDSKALAQAILRLYRDREFRRILEFNGRSRAEAAFSLDFAVAAYDQILRRVLSPKPTVPALNTVQNYR